MLLAALGSAPASGQRYNFRHYTSLEGIPQRQILAIHQDDTGYIWFGTYAGLSRYDGSELVTLTARDGLEANPVQEIVGDGAGGLWIGTLGGGVCHLDPGIVRPTCPGAGLEPGSGRVNAILPAPDGGLWVATDAGLDLVATDGSPDPVDFGPGAARDPAVRALARDRQGALWIGTDHGLYRRGGDGTVEDVPLRPGGSVPVLSLLIRPDGTLFVGTETGLYRLEGRGDPPTAISLPPASEGNVITDIVSGENGTLWIGTRNGVVRRGEDSAAIRITTRNGLLSNRIHEIVTDREGNVWFGTDSGASKLVPGPFEVFGAPEDLPHPFVRALASDPSGRLWIGTRDGLAWLAEGEVVRPPSADLPSSRIYTFARVTGDRMLIGTWNGLAEWGSEGVVRTWARTNGLPSSYVTALSEDGEEGAWVGTDRGMAHWRDGRIEPIAVDELRTIYVTTIHRHPDGSLWIGTVDRGVAVLRDGTDLRWMDTPTGALTSEAVWSIDHDRDGRIWVGTNGQGAFRIDGSEIERITTEEGLVDDFVWQVLVDREEDVWFYTNRGLDRLRNDGSWSHYGPADGLVDLEGSATAVLEDEGGDLWFGTGSGLVHYRRGREWKPRTAPTVVLQEALDAAGARIPRGARLDLDAVPISVRFAALTFRDERSVRYRYRVLGVSERWSSPVSHGHFTFSVRRPGTYELQVAAARSDGLWSPEPAVFPFALRPRPWQTWPVRIVLGLLAVVLVAGLVSLRTRKLERERRRLEKKVEARTRELRDINRKLRHLASVDDLTQVANRRRFIETLESDLRRLSRAPVGTCLALFLIDLDHFKDVNDRYGHLVGDAILQQIAARLREAVRSTDLVARYGGEEFAVVLPHTDARGARELAEKIRRRIAEEAFLVDGRSIALTASIGVFGTRQTDRSCEPLDVDDVLRRADAALYEAKRKGRNRVEAAPMEG